MSASMSGREQGIVVLSSSLSTTSSTKSSPVPPPIVYTIAGSDSGGGAGIQADLRAMHVWGCHGCSIITCITAQNSLAVTAVHVPPLSMLQAQWDALHTDLSPVAIKIGMLGTKELVEQVAAMIRQIKHKYSGGNYDDDDGNTESVHRQQLPGRACWVVLDPVMISTSGSRLIEPDAQQAIIDHLFPLVDIITPNKFEAEALLGGRSLDTLSSIEQAARDLLELGVRSVLIKGGHATTDSDQYAHDYFLSRDNSDTASHLSPLSSSSKSELRLCDGTQGVWLRSSRFDTVHTHGTGCTLSSSIAAVLALGERERHQPRMTRRGVLSAINLVDACCLAKAYVTAGIVEGVPLGQGPGPVAQTRFPECHSHYPAIVSNPTKEWSLQFRAMAPQADIASTTTKDNTLGQILPIVDTVEWVERLCQIEGVTDIQLRIKNEIDPDRILRCVERAQQACKQANVRLWINDHWQAAVRAGCFGVHIGQEDLCRLLTTMDRSDDTNKERQSMLQALNGMALGISTHSYGELSVALGIKPTYVSLGPIYSTSSKTVRFDPQGLSTIRKWRELIPPDIPLVCIGGIVNADVAQAVRQAGADCVAVIGAITQAPNTSDAVAELLGRSISKHTFELER